MKKNLIILAVIILIIIILIIAINVIDWSKLTIGILEQTSGFDIKYEKIEGRLFSGYRLENYSIKISPTDSIVGKFADINYRFSLRRLSLPTIFQINLFEPVINIKRGKSETSGGKFTLPKINLSLRVNIKNGKFIYEDDKKYETEHISGLMFIDFMGTNLYVSTMNLSFTTPVYPLHIQSANIQLNISSERIETKSFQLKGDGLLLQGDGAYFIKRKTVLLNIKAGKLDFNKMGIYQGRIDFHGKCSFENGVIMPTIQGVAHEINFIESFNFESNFMGDTIIINIFDGQALAGTFSAQVKLQDLKTYTIETNFRNIDINRILKINKPILINGQLGYKEKKFRGILNSPVENGLAIENLYISGFFKNGAIHVDTLSVNEKNLTIFARGPLYPDFDINIDLYNFDFEKIKNIYPITGTGSGLVHFKGSFNSLLNTSFDINLNLLNITADEFDAKKLTLKTENFVWKKRLESLKLIVDSLSFMKYNLKNIALTITNENKFLLTGTGHNDTIQLTGEIQAECNGKIDSLIIIHNQITLLNINPINFDILNKKIDEFGFKFARGELYISIKEGSISFANCQLEELARFIGLKERIKGNLNVKLDKNSLFVKADSIYYRGLNNGSLTINGNVVSKKIIINQLSIADDNMQNLIARGSVSLDDSKINVQFKDVKPWIFPFLNNFMDRPDGLLSGEIEFSGNLNDFKLTGNSEVKNASFGINIIGAKFDSGYAQIQFNENQIIFETIKSQTYSGSLARSGNRALVTGGGIIKLEPHFRVKNLRFDFSFQDAPLQYQNFAYGIGTGNFSLIMRDEIMEYKGQINIKEGVIPLEFGTPLETGAEEQKQDWRMNLKLSAERNIWLRNRDADIEFGGEIYVIKEQPDLYVSGILETKRGNYYWLNHILKITSGQINFIPQELIDPELDIWAELNTHERELHTNQEIKIILHCTGPISEPVFEFFSDPPIYSEQDILTYLNFNITWQELESMKQDEYVGKVLPQSILAWLESDVSRKLRAYTGLDYFRIEAPLFATDEKTKLTVGKYVSRNLFITYTYDITSFSNEFNVEYFINDRNEILIKRDETGEYLLQYQYRIRF